MNAKANIAVLIYVIFFTASSITYYKGLEKKNRSRSKGDVDFCVLYAFIF